METETPQNTKLNPELLLRNPNPSKAAVLAHSIDRPVTFWQWMLKLGIQGFVTGVCTVGVQAGANKLSERRARTKASRPAATGTGR